MDKNKIIDHFYKKLLLEGFSNQEINNFVALKYKFNDFNYYLYYLWLLANDKKFIHHEDYKLAKILESYLWTIIERENIKPLEIENIKLHQLISNQELFLIDLKNYELDQWYYQVNEYLIIFINQFDYEINNQKIKIRFNKEFDHKWWIFFNQYLLKHKMKILIFDKQEYNNRFLGYFYNWEINLNINKNQIYDYYLIFDNTKCSTKQLNNLSNHFEINLFNQLKTKISKEVDFIQKINFINNVNNPIILFNLIIIYCLINHKKEQLNTFLNSTEQNCFKALLNHLSLVSDVSYINNFFLLLLSNHYELIFTNTIVSDALNNIYIVYDKSSNFIKFNDRDQTFNLNFINDHHTALFDHELNKKIFNTINNKACIYIFERINNDLYLFKGYYLVDKIYFNEQKQPTFLLTKMNKLYLLNHYCYWFKNHINNEYENVFINNVNEQIYQQWAHSKQEKIPVNEIDISNEKLNAYYFKFKWIYDKCLLHLNDDECTRYLELFNELYFRINNHINLIKNKQYREVLKNHLIDLNYFIYYFYLNVANKKQKKEIKNYFTKNNEASYEAKLNFFLNLIK